MVYATPGFDQPGRSKKGLISIELATKAYFVLSKLKDTEPWQFAQLVDWAHGKRELNPALVSEIRKGEIIDNNLFEKLILSVIYELVNHSVEP